ncbi:hypothetical protein GCM10010129_02000 [Streptomyces fumigatiscleroticus]|nr:hypothetical protein GCM10010129_02000 [Streptomyces fumigatiscleroticus]
MVSSNANAQPTTFVYVHGAGNKPPVDALKLAWDRDLFQRGMGDRSVMVHYADLLHERPASTAADACSAAGALPALVSDALADTAFPGDETGAREAFGALTPQAQEFALSLAVGMAARAASPTAVVPAGPADRSAAAGLLPLPAPLRRVLLRQLLRSFIPDAGRYFFTDDRERIRDRLRTVLAGLDGPAVVVGHSLGTAVAYDVLSETAFAGADIPLLVTVGSPLGYTEIQDAVAKPLRIPAPVRLWMNFADPFDPVTLDTTLADDFRHAAGLIADVVVDNVSPNNHASCGYLRTRAVRDVVTAAE